MRISVSGLALLVIVALGCDKAPSPVVDAGPKDAPSPQQEDTLFEIKVDGNVVTRVTKRALSKPVELRELLPPALRDDAAWAFVQARAGQRTVRVDAPSERYPGASFLVSEGESVTSFVVRRRVDTTLPKAVQAAAAQPLASLSDLTGISIVTRAHAAKSEAKLDAPTVTLLVDGTSSTFTEAELAKVTVRQIGRKVAGYFVADLVAQKVPLTEVTSVVVEALEGKQETIPLASLTDPTEAWILKVNRNNALRLRHFEHVRPQDVEIVASPLASGQAQAPPAPRADKGAKKSERAEQVSQLRDVQRIVVTTRSGKDGG